MHFLLYAGKLYSIQEKDRGGGGKAKQIHFTDHRYPKTDRGTVIVLQRSRSGVVTSTKKVGQRVYLCITFYSLLYITALISLIRLDYHNYH